MRKRIMTFLIPAILIVLVYIYIVQINCLKNVSVTDSFIQSIDNRLKYCRSYQSAINGDSAAFKYLVDQNFYDGLVYEHGFVLSVVVDSLGQDVIARWMQSQYIDNDKLKTYLMGAQDWRNSGKYENREFVWDRYPLIFRQIED